MGKKLLFRAISAAVTVLLCVSATALTAYAYFSATVYSSSTLVRSATFQIEIRVTPDEETQYTQVTVDAFTQQVILTPGSYTLTLALRENSTANTGFCRVEIGDRVYCTGQMSDSIEGLSSALTWRVLVSEETAVSVSARWGTCANCSAGEQLLSSGMELDLRAPETPAMPSVEEQPTEAPTEAATEAPTEAPTEEATDEATEAPTEAPTETGATDDAPAEE